MRHSSKKNETVELGTSRKRQDKILRLSAKYTKFQGLKYFLIQTANPKYFFSTLFFVFPILDE